MATSSPSNDAILTSIITNGDLSKLSPDQKVDYYRTFCERLGLDPLSQPFKLLRLNGKEILYCDRSGTQQLCKLHDVSHEIRAREIVNGCYVVTAQASTPDNRQTESIGAVPIENLRGDNLCNAMMKAETKAKRRATLDLLGLGILDETETDAIPSTVKADAPVQQKPATAVTALAGSGLKVENNKVSLPEGYDQAVLDAHLGAIYASATAREAISLYDSAPFWMKRDKAFRNTVDGHMAFTFPDEWDGYMAARFRKVYKTQEELLDVLEVTSSVSELSGLYYFNIEAIEKDADLKAAFTARKPMVREKEANG